jgi:SNF2 family DNA or RNA helicase
MYELGQWIKKRENGQRVQVLEIFETWGYLSLKVYNPEENKIEFLSANRVLEEWDQEIDGDYIKYKIVLLKLLQEISQGMLTSLKEGVIPLPHQLYVLKRALSESRIRYVLADEVGLGKTIEAGLIIRELKARGLVKRVLIICPKGLVSQWNLELKEKFDEYFNIILPSEYETIKRIINKDQVYSQFDQVISPMDSIKPIERRAGWTQDEIKKYNEERIYSIIEADWDLIIIDEAHRMAGSSDQVARYKLGKMLSKASPYLLLLTATPHSGKTDQFLRLLGFLDQDAFPNYQSLIKENVSQYIIRTEKREAIDNKGERLFRDRKTHLVEVKWDEKHSNQSRLYEMVTEYVKKGYNRAIKEKKSYVGFLMVLMQRLVTSSTAAIKDSISRRIEILESQQVKIHNLSFDDLADMDFEEGMGQALELASIDIKNEIKDLKEILALAKQAEYQAIDAKAERLLDYLDELYSKDNEMKAIIFTEFVETQNYLRMFLHNKGYSISILNGSMDMEERDRILLEFKDDNNILISTDTGGEGLNLQFANIVINYDLPWNPMKIEQRIGRVDRIGQVKDVLVYNFINIDTVENRVRSILESKLATILDETGINKLSDLLDNEMAEMDFTDIYMKSIRDEKFINHNVNKFEEEFRKQVEIRNQYKEIIKDNKDLSDESYSESHFDLDKNLNRILDYYQASKGLTLPRKNLSLTNPLIEKHINKDLEWHILDSVPRFSIRDFPNEDGYFTIWQISLGEERQYKDYIPLFLTKKMLYRPMSGRKIWEELYREEDNIEFIGMSEIERSLYERIAEKAEEIAYDNFLSLKNKYELKNKDNYRKYKHSIEVKKDLAMKIGIDNIRNSKLKALDKELIEIEKDYEEKKGLVPILLPVFIAELVK